MRGLVQPSMLPGGLFADIKAKTLCSENNSVLGDKCGKFGTWLCRKRTGPVGPNGPTVRAHEGCRWQLEGAAVFLGKLRSAVAEGRQQPQEALQKGKVL